MKREESNTTYNAKTASLLRRIPQLISQAAIPQEAGMALLLPGMISFVLDELMSELVQVQDDIENTTCICNHQGNSLSLEEKLLSTASRIYNLVPLYADAISTVEKLYLGKVISKCFAELSENYSLRQPGKLLQPWPRHCQKICA